MKAHLRPQDWNDNRSKRQLYWIKFSFEMPPSKLKNIFIYNCHFWLKFTFCIISFTQRSFTLYKFRIKNWINELWQENFYASFIINISCSHKKCIIWLILVNTIVLRFQVGSRLKSDYLAIHNKIYCHLKSKYYHLLSVNNTTLDKIEKYSKHFKINISYIPHYKCTKQPCFNR